MKIKSANLDGADAVLCLVNMTDLSLPAFDSPRYVNFVLALLKAFFLYFKMLKKRAMKSRRGLPIFAIDNGQNMIPGDHTRRPLPFL